MPHIPGQLRDGGWSRLPGAAADALQKALSGSLLRSGQAGYERARAVWNAAIDRRPALIACCANNADVQAGLNFAREQGLLLAVRGGGHNIAGLGICDGGLVLDLSALRSVDVNPGRRSARVGGGATLADLDGATQEQGLAVPAGVVSATGVGGLTLGGGFGRLSRLHGLTADNLLAAEVVTADGEVLTANPTRHAELFWGLRGGGGNFGVVTRFEFRLHTLRRHVLFGPIVYRLEDAAETLAHYREFACAAPRECCIWADLLAAPPLPFLPEALHGRPVLFVVPFYAGDHNTGLDLLEPLRRFGKPVADAVGPVPYTAAQTAIDDLYGPGAGNYWKSHNFKTLSDKTITTLVDYAGRLPTPQSDILISQVGGAINDLPADATAYPHRDVEFVISPGLRWQPAHTEPAGMRWLRAWHAELAGEAAGGAYVNFISEAAGGEHAAFGGNFPRLAALKAEYDPQNLFRLNQNVRPGAYTKV